jgi:uncharacterized protein YegP (UPF0339 family)
MSVKFYLDGAGKYRWHAVSSNHLIVADSGQGYSTKSNARRAWLRFEAQVRAGIAVAP